MVTRMHEPEDMAPSAPEAPVECDYRTRGPLRNALAGVRTAWHEDRGARSQLLGLFAMAMVLILTHPPLPWSALAMFASLTAFSLELMNTALEDLADQVQPEYSPAIRKIKDIAAAAVVVASLGVLGIGLTVLFVAWRMAG